MKLLSFIAISSFAATAFANGPAPGCLQTYTIKDGDGCEGIAASFSLTPDEFYNMNPGLHHAGDHLCDNLDTGKPYCVCMKKPCAQQKDSTSASPAVSGAATSSKAAASAASGSIKTAGTSVVPSAASSAVSGASSMPTLAASAASSGAANATGASASSSSSVAPSSSSAEKLASSVAVIALIAGAASVFAM
ncbi:hypothetical protein VKS41_004718 [Umbelopsis sp. WA50703]